LASPFLSLAQGRDNTSHNTNIACFLRAERNRRVGGSTGFPRYGRNTWLLVTSFESINQNIHVIVVIPEVGSKRFTKLQDLRSLLDAIYEAVGGC
jgi:hypothetical protein